MSLDYVTHIPHTTGINNVESVYSSMVINTKFDHTVTTLIVFGLSWAWGF